MLFALTFGNEHSGQQEGWDGGGSPGDRSHSLLGPAVCLNKYMFTRQPHAPHITHCHHGGGGTAGGTGTGQRAGSVSVGEGERAMACGFVFRSLVALEDRSISRSRWDGQSLPASSVFLIFLHLAKILVRGAKSLPSRVIRKQGKRNLGTAMRWAGKRQYRAPNSGNQRKI